MRGSLGKIEWPATMFKKVIVTGRTSTSRKENIQSLSMGERETTKNVLSNKL